MFSRTRLFAIAGLAVLAIALVGVAACGDDDDDDDGGGASSAQIEELTARLERVDVETALVALDAAGFHEIDEGLQEASEIPSGDAGAIERAYAVASKTEWPDGLTEQSEPLVQALEDFMAAIEADDLESAKGLATDTHEAFHELQHASYDWISGEVHADEEDEHEEAEESPAAEATH